jgi:hypothetical protein
MLLLQKKSTTIFLSLFLFAFFVSSCNRSSSSLKEYGPIVQSVILSNNGVFRGLSLGDKMDSVQRSEPIQPMEVDDGYLYYEYKIDSTASFNISYNFEEAGLSEIQSDIYIHDPKNTETIFNQFKTFFEEHYGTSEDQQGYTIWSVKSEKYNSVKINLSDESADLTVPNSPGKISIWIYPDKE